MRLTLKKIIISALLFCVASLIVGCDYTTAENTTVPTTGAEITTTLSTDDCLITASLEVTPPTKTAYEINDILNYSGMVVTFIFNDNTVILNAMQYSVASVNMSTEGVKTVTVSFLGLTDTFTITVGEAYVIDPNLDGYYDGTSGLTGNALLLELRDIINTGFSGVSYDAVRYILDETDADPDNPSNVILMYSGTSVSGAWSENGVTWNREHVWPQSLLGVSASGTNAASDLHNLKPTNPSFNSSRNNKYFDNTTTAASYAPRNEVRGDIARILLYM
ncbi:MAG: endonuclease, partial [Candidatus Izemoplasmatales bacterium]